MKKLLFILAILLFLSFSAFAQNANRVIKIDQRDFIDYKRFLEITSLKLNDNEIFFNESFIADENWLKNIKVKVKNISGKTINCVVVVFGLLEGVDEKLEPHMSWGNKLAFNYGNCSENNKEKFKLKNREEVELQYNEIDDRTKKYFEKIGTEKFHKAELIYGSIKFKNGDWVDNKNWLIPNNVRSFDEDKN